jgi:hypothetical protein
MGARGIITANIEAITRRQLCAGSYLTAASVNGVYVQRAGEWLRAGNGTMGVPILTPEGIKTSCSQT